MDGVAPYQMVLGVTSTRRYNTARRRRLLAKRRGPQNWWSALLAGSDYGYYRQQLPEWRQQIVNLLNNHKIRLVSDSVFYVVHMEEARDDKVHYYKFVRTPL